MKKRLLALAMVLVLALSLLPGTALAADYQLWVNGVQVTDENAGDILSDGGSVSYNTATNTLTLNGATLDTTYSDTDDSGVIYHKGTGDLTISVNGTNSITSDSGAGILAWGNLKLTGSGSLTVNIDGAYTAVFGNNIRIDSGIYNLTSTGSNSLFAPSNGISIGGTADVTADGYWGIVSYGSNDTVISGSAVVNTTCADGCALFSEANIEVNGGKVVAHSQNEAAIYPWGDMTITNGAEVVCSTDEYDRYGIYVAGKLTVSNSASLTVTDVMDAGICADGGIDVIGGTVDTLAIYSAGDINISGGAKLTAGEYNGNTI